MRKLAVIVSLLCAMSLAGCSSRPITKTWHHLKRGYHTTKQMYHTSKAVAEVLNPLEYVYVAEHGESLTPDGEPFVTGDAVLAQPEQAAE
jgi:uncharacterized lipoprotein YmbA